MVFTEGAALAPPAVPKLTEVSPGGGSLVGEIVGEQVGTAEETGEVGKSVGFGLKADEGGLEEEVILGFGGYSSEKGAALAGELERERGLSTVPVSEVLDGGIEVGLEAEGRQGGLGGAVPDDVQDDSGEARVTGVTVCVPIQQRGDQPRRHR